MRKRDLIKKQKHNKDMNNIKDFMNLSNDEISEHEIPGGYIVDLSSNIEAQKIFKSINPYGNTDIPKHYDFSKEILLTWDDSKQAAKLLF